MELGYPRELINLSGDVEVSKVQILENVAD